MKRVGIDIGGTFTDLVVFDEVTGAVERTKTLTALANADRWSVRRLRPRNDCNSFSRSRRGTPPR